MALTRARVVAGPAGLRKKVTASIAGALAQAGDPDRILADARTMRTRMLKELPPDGPWDVKHRPGGQIEVEFIAQTLQLVHAAQHPGICSQTTRSVLRRLAEAGLLPMADAEVLILADRVWRTIQGMLRITDGRNAAAELPETTLRPLLRALADAGLPAVDLPGLRSTLDDLAKQVRAAFVRHIGEIGG